MVQLRNLSCQDQQLLRHPQRHQGVKQALSPADDLQLECVANSCAVSTRSSAPTACASVRPDFTAGGMLGSRLASFVGLLEVAAAGLWAWMLLGENLSMLQFFGGGLILLGIGFVHSDRSGPLPLDGVRRPISGRRARARALSRTESAAARETSSGAAF